MNFLAVFIGGGIGSLLRYSIGLGFQHFKLKGYPLGTLIANILACLVMGLFLSWAHDKTDLPEHYKKMLLVGLCGGLSTFSTFSLDSLKLIREGQTLIATLNIVTSITLCLLILNHFSQKLS